MAPLTPLRVVLASLPLALMAMGAAAESLLLLNSCHLTEEPSWLLEKPLWLPDTHRLRLSAL